MSYLVLGAAIEASLQIIGSYSLGVEESFQSGKHPCFPRGYIKRMTKFFDAFVQRIYIFTNPYDKPHYDIIFGIGDSHANLYESLINVIS
jgi:hypothetical protein